MENRNEQFDVFGAVIKNQWKQFVLSPTDILGAMLTNTPIFYIDEKEKIIHPIRIASVSIGDGGTVCANMFYEGVCGEHWVDFEMKKSVVDRHGAAEFAKEFGIRINVS